MRNKQSYRKVGVFLLMGILSIGILDYLGTQNFNETLERCQSKEIQDCEMITDFKGNLIGITYDHQVNMESARCFEYNEPVPCDESYLKRMIR